MTRVDADGHSDVPALRATVLCKYGEWLLGQQNGSWVAEELWPVINRDLGWIHRHWNDSWVMIDGETIDTQSFWTAVVQHRALRSGAALGRKLRSMDDLAGYEMQAKKILVHMQTFWYEKEGQIRARRFDGRSGLDSAAHLASVWNFDPVGGCDALTFQPCSDRALSNLKATIDRFKGLYPVSKYIPESEPGPLSMQFEDTYEGDMPWQLVIFGAAEQLYDALTTWALFESLSVTRISLPFFRLFSTDVAPGTYMKTSDMYNTLTGRVRAYADRALLLCAERTLDNGVPPEGRDGNIGVWTNATRTHVAALTAFAARQGKAPAPWGAKHVLWEFGELEDDGWEVLPDSPFVKKVVEFVLKMYHRAM
ncbi:Six-hairpin glycosidase [Artomyces pyxidatus]|uniref:Six-hairpin glycosidase n=1 Tax=Artomyces pyxidatus TaxID=48021 RepID=A0ACB8TFA5_9AGAM|nr:Six-hairpin glycosidase [Artomyces pyxidatus]